jgi:integrase
MARIASAFTVQRRSKKNKNFIITLNPECGLPAEICGNWQRRSFSFLPPELSSFRSPTSKSVAENGAVALIEFLKNQLQCGISFVSTDTVKIGHWLERFTALDDNPRAARIMGAGSPYSISTIEDYRNKYERYVKDDPFCQIKMSEVEQTHCLAFMARLGMKEKDKRSGGGPIAGTRTYEIILRFIRMAFTEYGETHEIWRNPFDRIKPPKSKAPQERDILETWEIRKLFEPGIIPDPLDRALAAAMFWGGMRRGEIYGLRPEDLNWKIPRIIIRNAWQCYGGKKKKLGDPKWHKIREIPFPIQLQEAIRELWTVYGQHEFVFCDQRGKLPGAKYLQRWLPRWIEAAGIDLCGRNIVPHGSRHSLASALEDSGVSLRQIQDMLGHSTLKTTKRYLHDTANHINKMGSKIDDFARQETKPAPLPFNAERGEVAG